MEPEKFFTFSGLLFLYIVYKILGLFFDKPHSETHYHGDVHNHYSKDKIKKRK